MNFSFLPPRDQIVLIMAQIYSAGMTTTSGGNISIHEGNGDIWITPAGVDKGSLRPRDVVCVRQDGSVDGLHRPSSELPFHRAIYQRRPDLKAIVHAHPPALVSFSIVRRSPDTRVIPQAKEVCGPVGYARYELPGSEELGLSIAREFEAGFNAVVMENHGTVVGGSTLARAFQRFETLEFCARTVIKANTIGREHVLSDEQVKQFEQQKDHFLPEMETVEHPADERTLRAEICKFVDRACRHKLMISTFGTVAVRWRENDFLITPTGVDRRRLRPEEIVQIRNGRREPGRLPSRAVRLVRDIFEGHPEINCVIATQPPNAMAFCISGRSMDTRTIPESYILLKDIPMAAYDSPFGGNPDIPGRISKKAPIVLIENHAVLVTGSSLLDTFDRLEVAEFSARSLVNTVPLGEMVPIGEQEIEDLKRKFLPGDL